MLVGGRPHISHQGCYSIIKCLDFSLDTYDLRLIQKDKFTKLLLFNPLVTPAKALRSISQKQSLIDENQMQGSMNEKDNDLKHYYLPISIIYRSD